MWLVDQVLQKKRKHTYTAIMSEKDGVTLNVSVDNTLFVEDRQGFQDRQAHRSNLLLVHPENGTQTSLLFTIAISQWYHYCFITPNATTVQAMVSHGNNAP